MGIPVNITRGEISLEDKEDNETIGNPPVSPPAELPLVEPDQGVEEDIDTGVATDPVVLPFGEDYDGGDYDGDAKEDDELSRDAQADIDEDGRPDAGEKEAEDVYHPDTQTPSIQRVMGQRSPVRTRSMTNRRINSREDHVLHHCMLQLSLKQGRKVFGAERTDEGVTKEFHQIIMKNAFEPKMPASLTPEEKKKALNTIMLLKEKTNEKM